MEPQIESDMKDNLFNDQITKNKKLELMLEQRELQIDKLFKEISKKEVKTQLLKKPTEILLRKKMEKMQKQLNQAEELIERYINVIQDLYNLLEKITNRKIDSSSLELLKRDKVFI